MGSVAYQGDGGSTVYSWANCMDEQTVGINSFYYFARLRWMTAVLMSGIWYGKTTGRGDYTLSRVETFSHATMLQTSFFFDRDQRWTASLNASYSSREKDVTHTLRSRYMVDLGVQHRCCRDRLTIGLTCRNLLASHIRGTEHQGATDMTFDNKFNYRQAHLTLTWNWGARLRPKQRQYEADEVKQRVVNDF